MSHKLGRPKVKATRRQVQMLRRDRWTWEQVASKLGISRATAIRLASDEGAEGVEVRKTPFGLYERIVLKPAIITDADNPLDLPI